jgi:hypothetical protein
MTRFLAALAASTLIGSTVLATATPAEAIPRGWGYGAWASPYYGYAPDYNYGYAPNYNFGYAPNYNFGYAPGYNYAPDRY